MNMTAGRVSNRQTRSSFSSSGEKPATRSSFTSSGEKQQPRLSYGSGDFGLVTTSFSPAVAAASPSTQHQQSNHHHQQLQRSSICSRVSSLTRDSSLRSLDNEKIDITDLTNLFGRNREKEVLKDAFLRVLKPDCLQKEIVLIRGENGTGKTSLMMDFKDSVTCTGTAHFCSGSFSGNQPMASPYSGIVQALDNLCEVIYSASDRDERRKCLYSSIGDDRLLEYSKLLPKLQVLLFGSYVEEEDPTESNAEDRWRNKSHKLRSILFDLFRALCSSSHAIILCLDDLQSADAGSLNLISNLISDLQSSNFMFVGAYRDDETPHLTITSNNTSPTQRFQEIKLQNLGLESVNSILTDITGSSGATTDLAQIVLEKTLGNPASIFQFLEMLQRKQLLLFCFHTHKWSWDLEQIKSKTEVTENVGHVLVNHIRKLSKEGKTVMNLAATIGISFDPNLLEQLAMRLELLEVWFREHVSTALMGVVQDAVAGGLIHPDQMQEVMATQLEMAEDESDTSLRKSYYEETIHSILQEAELEGLVGKPLDEAKFRFSHELVHEALYNITPPGIEQERLHLLIGREMKSFYSARSGDDEMLFAAVHHLNRGSSHLENDLERIELIQLNQKASTRAKLKPALFFAADFSKRAVDLLRIEHDWSNNYDLMLDVYSEAAELNFACGRFDISLQRCAEVGRHGKCLADKLRAFHVRIEVLHSQRQSKDAITYCLNVLKELGESISSRTSRMQVWNELRRTRRCLKGHSEDALLSLVQMEDPIIIQRMRFLCLLLKIIFDSSNDMMVPLVILRMMQVSIRHGFCEYTPIAFAGYGMVSTVTGSVQEAYHFGSHAITLCGRVGTSICIPGTYFVVFSFLDHLQKPLINGVEPVLKGYQVGLGNGEVHFAAASIAASAALGFICGLPLKGYSNDLKKACEQLKTIKQENVLLLVAPYLQSALSLTGEVSTTEFSIGKGVDEKHFLNSLGIQDFRRGLEKYNYFMLCYMVAYIFNDTKLAHETRKEMMKQRGRVTKYLHFMVYMEVFFSGLLDFARYRLRKRRKTLRQAKRAVRIMEKYVKDGIVNCNGMALLLRAELGSFGDGDEEVTKKLYEDAVKKFAAGGFMHFAAIANERAAEFMLKVGKKAWFETYIKISARSYSDWGASAKALQLVEEHKLPTKLLTESGPVVQGRGDDARRFTPIECLVEEDYISSDLI